MSDYVANTYFEVMFGAPAWPERAVHIGERPGHGI